MLFEGQNGILRSLFQASKTLKYSERRQYTTELIVFSNPIPRDFKIPSITASVCLTCAAISPTFAVLPSASMLAVPEIITRFCCAEISIAREKELP